VKGIEPSSSAWKAVASRLSAAAEGLLDAAGEGCIHLRKLRARPLTDRTVALSRLGVTGMLERSPVFYVEGCGVRRVMNAPSYSSFAPISIIIVTLFRGWIGRPDEM
jgi:hypothetical protein